MDHENIRTLKLLEEIEKGHVPSRFYKEARKILKKIFSDFKAEGNRHIIFYGASDFAEIAYLSLRELPRNNLRILLALLSVFFVVITGT